MADLEANIITAQDEKILDTLLARVELYATLIKHDNRPYIENGILPGFEMAIKALMELPAGHPIRLKYDPPKVSQDLARIIKYCHEMESLYALHQLKKPA